MKLKKYLKYLAIPGGALLGFSYYYFIGCTSGSCPITSNPYISTVYGAFVGWILSINGKGKPDAADNKGN